MTDKNLQDLVHDSAINWYEKSRVLRREEDTNVIVVTVGLLGGAPAWAQRAFPDGMIGEIRYPAGMLDEVEGVNLRQAMNEMVEERINLDVQELAMYSSFDSWRGV